MVRHNNFQVSAHLVIGVTGHRNLHQDEFASLQDKTRRFFQALQLRYPNLPLCLLSSLAAGSDQLVTDVALEMGIHVIAPLPMAQEQYLADFESSESREIFLRQCQQAELLTMPLHQGSLLDAIKLPGPERDLQYAQAGIFVSSHCHILLALWDGKESELLGGTAQVVNFHLQGSMPGPIDRQRAALGLLGMVDDTLVYHITANRQNQALAAIPESTRWLTSNQGIVSQPTLPEAFDFMFGRHAAFNRDWHRYERVIAQQPLDEVADAECPIHSLFRAADCLANIYQKRISHVLKVTYLLAAFLGAAFIIFADRYAQNELLYLFLALILAGLGFASIVKRREWHRKYIDYRVLAEGLRVQSYWRRAGIVYNNTPSFTHESLIQPALIELGWIRNIMRTATIDGILNPNANTEPQIDAVIEQWIGDSEHSGQLQYFSKSSEKRMRLRNRSEMIGHSLLWMGIALSLVLVMFSQLLQDALQNIMIASMGVLSVAAAIHEAYVYKKADKVLIKQYHYMHRIFSSALQRIGSCKNTNEQRQILRTLGEAALAEHAEWTLMHRERPLQNSLQK